VNAVLKEIIATGRTLAPDGSSVDVHSSVHRDEGTLLQDLVREVHPTTTLEIGLAYGISALYICDALEVTPTTRHIVIDPNQCNHESGPWGDPWHGIGLHTLNRAGFGNLIEFIPLPSHHALPQLDMDGRQIDFAFVDGWHTFDYTFIDFFYIDRMLRVGGVIAFDDAGMPGIRKLCRYIATNRAYRPIATAYQPPRLSWRRRLFDSALAWSPSAVTAAVVKPEVRDPDTSIGLHGTSIAFRKEATDDRPWWFHKPF
jgi:predicted O-methyltransferase YrrM